jgi:hypothetical protein
MRLSFEEPTGVWVQGADGETAALTFPAFVAVVEAGTVAPDDQVWSRIVTGGDWVRAGDMRLFQLLTGDHRTAPTDTGDVWPPAA